MAKVFAQRNPQQLIKLSGKDTFVEVMNDSFEIGKILLNFAKYNEKAEPGKRITDNIRIYMDLEEALVLAHDIVSGKLPQLAKIEKDKGSKYPREVYKKQGGTSAKSLKGTPRERPDGMAESRVLKIGPGGKVDFMLTAEKGKGEENATGLIVQKGTETTVRVPVSADDLKKLALVIQSNIQAYTISRYVDGSALTNPYQEAKKAKAQ
ncbi:hypothetical protein [Rossellomorea marisflavi]|uniref:hypothetical protein n=1 Tax=Rossellomorea marisflavi TaxID=189381 RepID=UPI003F9F99B9